MKHDKWLPYIALGIGILSLSLSAMFVRWAKAPGPVTGFYRLLFSTLILTPFFIQRQRRETAIPRAVLIFPLLAGTFTACDLAFWNSSLAYTTAANATLLGNTAPLWVALGAWLIFREKLSGRFWLGLALALTGAMLIMGSDFLLHPRLGNGDMMASTAAVFYASYMLSTQRGRQGIDPFRYTWLVGIAATFATLIINLLLDNALTGYDAQTWMVFLGTPLLKEVQNLTQALGGLIAMAGIYMVNQSHTKYE